MNRVDLRSRIIPTELKNINALTGRNGTKAFNTVDLIYLDSVTDQFNKKSDEIQKRISCTDFALMNYVSIGVNRTVLNKPTTCAWLRSGNKYDSIAAVSDRGNLDYMVTSFTKATLCPSLHFKLPSSRQDLISNEENANIKEIKDENGKVIYHTLQIGEYPKTKADENLSELLETLYNNGNIAKELTCTGRWYTVNGQQELFGNFVGKHIPEFEYKGNRYVRVVSYIYDSNDKYSDGTLAGQTGTVRWVKVEPISFVIKNWEEMPRNINPKGNGRAKFYNLRAEEGLLANIPFYPEYDVNSTLWQNSTIRGFLNGINVINIQENGNIEYVAFKGGDFSGKCNFLNEAFNLSREPITEYTIPLSENSIPKNSFNGCISLKKLEIHPGIKSIEENAFTGLSFKYAYKDEKKYTVLCKDIPKEQLEKSKILDIEKLSKVLDRFDYNILIKCERFEQLIKLVDILNKNKFSIPFSYAVELIENNYVEEFCENSDFRFFKSENPNINFLLKDCSDEEKLAFFKFATCLGCFSTERMSNKNKTIIAQKASSLLASILNTKKIKIGEYNKLFSSLQIDVKANDNFLKFLSVHGEKKNLNNIELILELEKSYNGLFTELMSNFDEVYILRNSFDKDGLPVKVSWHDAIENFYRNIKYVGVTKDNLDIAKVFEARRLGQETFDKACRLRKKAKCDKTPEHILGKPIKEETILESIERIKNQTEEEIKSGKDIFEQLYNQQFTYEWLSKNDPHNGIIGLLCSSCGSIVSDLYGREIARATITAPDVQNLVIRDLSGEIIAKGTMYVNKKLGYAVINDFELNADYRKHEIVSGIYDSKIEGRDEKNRELIFNAFQRGLKAFIEEYDRQNPDRPMQQVNVGMGYNKLRRQVERFKKDISLLTVPPEYFFQDAMSNAQYILYYRYEKEPGTEEER